MKNDLLYKVSEFNTHENVTNFGVVGHKAELSRFWRQSVKGQGHSQRGHMYMVKLNKNNN